MATCQNHDATLKHLYKYINPAGEAVFIFSYTSNQFPLRIQ